VSPEHARLIAGGVRVKSTASCSTVQTRSRRNFWRGSRGPTKRPFCWAWARMTECGSGVTCDVQLVRCIWDGPGGIEIVDMAHLRLVLAFPRAS
jgi:hypothetical protein